MRNVGLKLLIVQHKSLTLTAISLVLSTLALAQTLIEHPTAEAQIQPPAVGASAQLHDPAGKLIAAATFRELPDEVLINLSFPDRTALTGTHALQIHATGRCDPPDFSSAGPIYNPLSKQHGLLNPDGPMAGDLPSLVIGPAGLATYNTAATLVRLTAGAAPLIRPGGTALVVLAQPDDDQSQPEGNAGARSACGVIVAGATATGSFPVAAPGLASTSGRPDFTAALLVGGLGILLIGGGLLLRRRQGRPG
jgi:Cu-Zn family superoxide dismutase